MNPWVAASSARASPATVISPLRSPSPVVGWTSVVAPKLVPGSGPWISTGWLGSTPRVGEKLNPGSSPSASPAPPAPRNSLLLPSLTQQAEGVRSIRNRQGARCHHDGEVGDAQQHLACRNGPPNSGQLDTQKEVCDRSHPGGIADRQRDAGSRDRGGGHGENRDPEHEGKDEVAPDQRGQGNMPGLCLSSQGDPGPADRFTEGPDRPAPFLGRAADRRA